MFWYGPFITIRDFNKAKFENKQNQQLSSMLHTKKSLHVSSNAMKCSRLEIQYEQFKKFTREINEAVVIDK
jgi:hypothetical protein